MVRWQIEDTKRDPVKGAVSQGLVCLVFSEINMAIFSNSLLYPRCAVFPSHLQKHHFFKIIVQISFKVTRLNVFFVNLSVGVTVYVVLFSEVRFLERYDRFCCH